MEIGKKSSTAIILKSCASSIKLQKRNSLLFPSPAKQFHRNLQKKARFALFVMVASIEHCITIFASSHIKLYRHVLVAAEGRLEKKVSDKCTRIDFHA